MIDDLANEINVYISIEHKYSLAFVFVDHTILFELLKLLNDIENYIRYLRSAVTETSVAS